jgi:hypothetical protein
MQNPQFLTNEEGQRVGVVLDMATYEALIQSQLKDTSFLRDLSKEQLEALASSQLTSNAQEDLYKLIEKKKERELSLEEAKQLDNFLKQIDQLALLKARAMYTLQHLKL